MTKTHPADESVSDLKNRVKHQILELLGSATPVHQIVTLELNLTIRQAKAVLDALEALEGEAGDA